MGDGELIGAHTIGAGAIEVGVAGQAELHPRFNPRRAGRMVIAQIRDPEFAPPTVVHILATDIAFVAAKMRQQRLVRPIACAATGPIVEVFMLTPDEDQPVDRG